MDIIAPRPDPRLTPARPDLAAARLRGKVDAAAFAEPTAYHVVQATVPLHRRPEAGLAYDTELLFGERLDVYEIRDGWAWAQARLDGYVGYVRASALAEGEATPTHRVRALRSFRYPGPGIKATPLGYLPFGAAVRVEAIEDGYARTEAGFLFAGHLAPLGEHEADPVAVAEQFTGVPYLWGGKSSLGIDCSGLVQAACHACGLAAARDSDMQEETLGERIAIPNEAAHFRRGDLLFWPGHVALSRGDGTMVHATAYSMSVIIEPIGEALRRIAGQGHPLRTARRLPKP